MRTILAAVALLASLTLPSAAGAMITNGRFGNGLTAWTALGDFSVETGTYGPAGDPKLVLTTSPSSGAPAPPPLGTGAVAPDPDIINLLGISAADLEANDPPGFDAFEGSGVAQTFTLASAGTLRFTWQLFTDETLFANPFPDFAIFHIENQAGTFSQTLMFVDVRTEDTAGNFGPSATVFDSELPEQVFTLATPLAPDTYTIGVALFDVSDDEYDSAIALDNFMIVPEPHELLLLFSGLVALAWYGRPRQRD